MKLHKVELEQHPGCVGCGKDCNWRASTVHKDSVKSSHKFGCNTSFYR